MTNAHIVQIVTLGALHLAVWRLLIRSIRAIFRDVAPKRQEHASRLQVITLARTHKRLGGWVRVEAGK